jgi:hypothetical protein
MSLKLNPNHSIFRKGKNVYKFFPFNNKPQLPKTIKSNVPAPEPDLGPWINQRVKWSASISLEFPRWAWFMIFISLALILRAFI